jgi:hypothetical protein
VEVAPARKPKRPTSKIVEVAPSTRRKNVLPEVIVEVAPEASPERARRFGVIKEMAPVTKRKATSARSVAEIAPTLKKKAYKKPRPEVAPGNKP